MLESIFGFVRIVYIFHMNNNNNKTPAGITIYGELLSITRPNPMTVPRVEIINKN